MQTANETVLRRYDRLMLEHAPVGMALFEAQTLRLLSANPSYQALFEPTWREGQAIGHGLRDLLPEAVQAEVIALFEHVIQTGAAQEAQAYRTFSPTGGVRYWNWTLSPLVEEEQVCLVLVTITKVTATVLAHQEAERMQAALTQTTDAVARERQRLADRETILLSLRQVSEPTVLAQSVLSALGGCFSPSMAALYSTHAEPGSLSLLGTHTPIRVSAEPALFPAPLSSGQHPDLLQAMQSSAPIVMKRAEGKDQTKAQEWWWSVPETQCVIALPLWEKRCEGVLVLALRTEEAANELLNTLGECAPHLAEALASACLHAELSNEKQRLHTILDQLPEGVLLVEARTSKISYANPAAAHLLGLRLLQLLGTPLNQSALLSPYGRSKLVQRSVFQWNFALIDALWGKRSSSQELFIPRPDGSEVTVLSSAAPIRLHHGLISEAVIVFQDITALKRLEQHKNEFFAVANHELRTPLTIILGYSELLQMSAPSDGASMQQYALNSITHECQHLLRLIGDLLDVSRLEQAQLEVQKQKHDVLMIVGNLVSTFMETTSTHKLSLRLQEIEPHEPLLGWVDLPRLEQIVSNLTTNAIKYSPGGGKVEIGVRPVRDGQGMAQEVMIWVKDEGIGIATSDLPYLFERFYRAKKIDRSISGFGIGLYLTKELVQAHGGRIWVESTKGEGSTFFVQLPLGEPQEAILARK